MSPTLVRIWRSVRKLLPDSGGKIKLLLKWNKNALYESRFCLVDNGNCRAAQMNLSLTSWNLSSQEK